MPDERPHVPPGAVVAAFLLALVCVLVPFGVIGAVYAGIVLASRGRRREGYAVIVVGVVCAILGWTVAR